MTLDKDQTVREIAINHPATIRVFENLGIDYCCGGRRPLEEACEKASVPIAKAMQLLGELVAKDVSAGAREWNEASLFDLTAHIIKRHHGYVRDETPRVKMLLQKVVSRHGESHPELSSIQETFAVLSEELAAHMIKEERVLFPFLQQMEAARRTGGPFPAGCFPSVEFPIARMLAEHDDAGALTAKIRELSSNYQPPDGACPTYRGLYFALEEFERDLHHHVHLENNILFPRAVALERSLQETTHVRN
ncbi:MAG: iron-sulfur cluster repair di-iron protein [Bryobacteraceae bacterium]|jgi:regulator of cell morphogenesis and NO signaling